MKYERPNIEIVEANAELLTSSDMGPCATDIGAPDVSNDAKEYSIWDEVNETYNIIIRRNKTMEKIGFDKVKHTVVCLCITIQ